MMRYKLQDLIDIEHFQELRDRLNEIYSFPSSIVDNEGNNLTATAWQDVCAKFHRKNKEVDNYLFYIEGLIRVISESGLKRVKEIENRKQIQESEKKFRQVVENANEGIFIIQAGRYKFINDYGLRLFKRDRAELVGAEILEHVHPDDRHFVSERIERRLSGKQIEDIVEHRIIDANGQVKWVETRGGLTSWDGKTANIGFATDINERKQAEKALRESEEKRRNVFENAVEGIYQSTPEGTFINVNPAFASTLGYASPEEVISSISDIATQYFADPGDQHHFAMLLKTP